jgi:hypothetical protein
MNNRFLRPVTDPGGKMKTKRLFGILCSVLAVCGTLITVILPSATSIRGQGWSRIIAADRHLPRSEPSKILREPKISFEENRGQFDQRVRFAARGNGQTVFLTDEEAAFVYPMPSGGPKYGPVAGDTLEQRREIPETSEVFALKMKFIGANERSEFSAEDEIEGKRNYFKGSDQSKWITDVQRYSRVRVSGVYRGIGMAWYESATGELEYDLVVGPGADTEQIKLEFDGADRISVDDGGDLVIETLAGAVRHKKPVVYQWQDGAKHAVEGAYAVSDRQVGFVLGDYDRSKTLVIDPIPAPPITFSTYLGGSETDWPKDIKVDSANKVYVAGYTYSADFPITSGVNPASMDAFLTKLNANASAIVYSVLIGGSQGDSASALAIDDDGNAYLTGDTGSSDFPTALFTYDSVLGGTVDSFIMKIGPSGSTILRSTYIGGTDVENSYDLAIDSEGSAYIAGVTESSNFPTTAGTYDPTRGGDSDVFVTKLNPSGLSLAYSTFLGGISDFETAHSITVDSLGRAYVAGMAHTGTFPVTPGSFSTVHETSPSDCFVTKFNSSGSALVYSTLIGGDNYEVAHSIAIDSSGNAYITGYTWSENYPVTFGAFDQSFDSTGATFVTKLNSAGSNLTYSTYLEGEDGFAVGEGIVLDSSNSIFLTGRTSSTTFPTHLPYDSTHNGHSDVFLAKLNASPFSSLRASTYVGGSGNDQAEGIAVNYLGDAYVAAYTQSTDFPTTFGVIDRTHNGGSDAVIFRYDHYWLP